MRVAAFGRIERLHLRAGEPLFGTDTRVIRQIELSEIAQSIIVEADYCLKAEVAHLIRSIRAISKRAYSKN